MGISPLPLKSSPILGHIPSPPAHLRDWALSVEGFVKELRLEGYSPFTLRDYRTDVMRLAVWFAISPGELDSAHLRAAEDIMVEEGLGSGARRRRQSAFQRFMQYLDQGGEPKTRGAILLGRAREAPRLDQLLLALVYTTGLRLSEVASLEGRDVRLRKEIIICREGYRIIPQHPFLVEFFRDLKDHAPLATYRPVIPGLHGFPVNSRTLHSRFQRLVARLGMPGVRPDALRREASAHLTHAGVPPGLIQAFLGKDKGRPIAPRRGAFADLTCLRERLARLPA